MWKSNQEKWSELRKVGRSAFVWRYGVFGWGISTAILFAGLECSHNGWQAGLTQLPIALVVFPLCGVVWGRLMWRFFEWQHRRMASE